MPATKFTRVYQQELESLTIRESKHDEQESQPELTTGSAKWPSNAQTGNASASRHSIRGTRLTPHPAPSTDRRFHLHPPVHLAHSGAMDYPCSLHQSVLEGREAPRGDQACDGAAGVGRWRVNGWWREMGWGTCCAGEETQKGPVKGIHPCWQSYLPSGPDRFP